MPIDKMVSEEVLRFMNERNLPFIYAINYPLELAEKVVKILQKKSLHITTVESCTGGGLMDCITSIPGASEVTYGGRVTYSNEEKIKLGEEIGIGLREAIKIYGVYSIETAQNMALAGIISAADTAQIGVGITGCFFREDPNNPWILPGTVFIAVTNGEKNCHQKLTLSDEGKERRDVKREVIVYALKMIFKFLEKI